MHNQWLESLSKKPLINTFRLSFKVLLSKKLLFILTMLIFMVWSTLAEAIPYIFSMHIQKNSLVSVIILSVLIGLFVQIFTVSNYLYISKVILKSESEEAFMKNIKEIFIGALFFDYFIRALASVLAIVLIILPFLVIKQTFHLSGYFDVIQLLVLLLVMFIYPIVVHEITRAKNFKEAFLATFKIFSPQIWRASLNTLYAQFIIPFMVIIIGGYYMFTFFIDYLSLFDNVLLASIIAMLSSSVFSLFLSLLVLPISMMIAHTISLRK
jgi:hypothetical protein